ncbi:hypothetical protein NC651_037899 [Populus alba x Populus x berolinensis]|nr:hypothetical protein NC651_037899 [Populus alba x Populus x berolinensis]
MRLLSYDAFSNPYVDSCSKQCNAFKTRAIQVKDGLLSAFPGISVLLNPEKPRRGCFEIREEGGETFISLQNMKRPFPPLKALDMDQVISDIIDRVWINDSAFPNYSSDSVKANNPITTTAPPTCTCEEAASAVVSSAIGASANGEAVGTSATGPSAATGPSVGDSVGVDGSTLDGAGALEGDLAVGAGAFLGTAAGGGGGAMLSIPGASIGSLTWSTEML